MCLVVQSRRLAFVDTYILVMLVYKCYCDSSAQN